MREETSRQTAGGPRWKVFAGLGIALVMIVAGCSTAGQTPPPPSPTKTPIVTEDVSKISGSVKQCKGMDMSNNTIYPLRGGGVGVRGTINYTGSSTLMSATITVSLLDGDTQVDAGSISKNGPIRKGRSLSYDVQFPKAEVDNFSKYRVSISGGSFLQC